MMMRMRPPMPYWPAYPEPERARLEVAYRAAEAKYHRDIWRDFCIQFGVFAAGLVLLGGAIIWQLFQLP